MENVETQKNNINDIDSLKSAQEQIDTLEEKQKNSREETDAVFRCSKNSYQEEETK